MGVGQLLSSLLYGTQRTKLSADVVELKPGQVVRGTVLQLVNSQEAVLAIQGVKVHAKLETPLQQGASTWLTVLPDLGDGQIRLKPVDGVSVRGSGLAELMKAFGLQDTVENRQLFQLLAQSGLGLSKANMAALMSLAGQKPADVNAEQWNQAAILALKRGLPMDGVQVGALRESMFGQPLHQKLQHLQAALSQLLAQAGGRLPALTAKAAENAQASIDQVIRLGGSSSADATLSVRSRGHTAAEQAPGQPPVKLAAAAAAAAEQYRATAAGSAGPGAGQGAALQQAGAGASPPQAAAATARPGLPSAAAAALTGPGEGPQGAEGGVRTPAGSAPGAAAAAQGAARASGPSAAGSSGWSDATPASAERLAAMPPAAAPPLATHLPQGIAGATAAGAAGTGGNWVSQLLKSLGLDHEAAVLKAASETESTAAAAGGKLASAFAGSARMELPLSRESTHTNSLPGGLAPGGLTTAERAEIPPLKAALLNLMSSSDMPETIKETAQQAIQHLTGQQLLLSGDRSSPLTYFTLSLPLFAQDHSQTAAVHVQSRKTAEGSIDAENCRLWFDLSLAHLGHTLLDVQVINRMVSVTIHSDFSGMEQLVNHSREELNERLQDSGYSILTMKVQPYPEQAAVSEASSEAQFKNHYYDANPYRGVDIRI